MKAWQYTEDGHPIVLNEVSAPVAGAGELVLDVKASGICHSDIAHLDGVISYLLPGGALTLGHEIAGVVSELGPGVEGFSIGDRVAIKSDLMGPGTGRHGGFAPQVSVQSDLVLPVPDGVPWDQAAVSTDGGTTAYHAVTVRAGVKAGDRVGIIGFGGLGSLGVQTAVGLGAEVFVAEINERVFDAASAAGASEVATSIKHFEGLGLDAVIDFAGFGTTTAEAIATVRDGGTVVQVGLAVAEATINISDLTCREINLLGSLGGTVEDNAEVLRMMVERKLASSTVEIGFDQVAEGLQELREGRNAGRLVLRFD